MKNVLLLVHEDTGQEARLQAALDLTRAIQGHLICLDVVRLPAMAGDYFGENVDVYLLQDEKEREGQNQARIELRLKSEDVPWEMRNLVGDLADCVTRESGLADVIVLNRKLTDPNEPNMQATVTSVALKSHKPVLAVPEECRGFDAAGCAVVAWDGSAAAMAALTAALPLLRIAAQVVLLEVENKKRASTVEEAASYLSRHDIRPIINRSTPRNVDRARHVLVAEEIMMSCEEYKAAYCVMGAFGHSPIREAIVGGVTRAMLASSAIPLVLAH